MENILRVEHVEKYYGSSASITRALNDVSFTVSSGEFVGVMGASGSGKSTLLNMIATIDTVSAGHIYLSGVDLTEMDEKDTAIFRRENLGFIFQDFNLLDTLTLEENIALGLTIQHVNPKTIENCVRDIAAKLGITDILHKYPYEVSGGQKQRAASARAIVTNPRIILADEPTGALDSKNTNMFLETMTYMNEQLTATILMVTHDAQVASCCGRILFLKDGSIFNQLVRGEKSRKQFFSEVLDVLALLGGEVQNVR